MKGYVIRDVTTYRAYNARGTVSNLLSGEPKVFAAKGDAESYADLSHFRGHKIEAHA